MRFWQLGICGCLGFVLAGCEEPEQVVPVAPPGAVIPRTPPDKDDPAQAQGETVSVSPKPAGESTAKSTTYTPATPTAKGETKTTKNGVKYETLKEGTGEELKPGQVARLHYEGKLENGTVFDSSRTKAEPATFTLGTGGLIRGWEEAIPGMRVGETRKLIIPPALGYRDQQNGKIPPNSTLIFEVELLGVN
jgi:FKBP-type peptidyl-prolyl cis-trans isomerase